MLLYLIVFFSFSAMIALIYAVYSITASNKNIITKRLDKISLEKSMDVREEELRKPFLIRIVQPAVRQMTGFMLKVTPKEIINSYEMKIIAAGNPFNYGVNEWLTTQMFFMLVVPVFTVILGMVSDAAIEKILLFAVLEIIVGAFGPSMILITKTQQRQKEITKTLPDILDLLTVSVEAGLGFDAALGKVVEKMPGVLAKEFDKVLQEIKMGKPRKDALRNMSDRLGVVDVTTFIASVIQADQLGVSIGNVLRVQSDQMRVRRRQRAQEKAMKAPIKMLLPMVFFIFPTIFTVLLGPVVIRLMETFAK
ncbi:type II secretion system F family protein [Petroclostridium sp. X23]|uniref:type II secretion system F family protein n=1 Tax=Petroclostridium sp. X23 TaxID=3045146 RepID=UPI0024ACD7F2|nr:type II secretion system F family protein [Petroclostridium sp. X23]WHH60534.1 type II secretion system F family protein [Petroclostridium sp. X23]